MSPWFRRQLLYVVTACILGAWLGTAIVVFVERNLDYLIGLALWTFNAVYYTRLSYGAHEASKIKPVEGPP